MAKQAALPPQGKRRPPSATRRTPLPSHAVDVLGSSGGFSDNDGRTRGVAPIHRRKWHFNLTFLNDFLFAVIIFTFFHFLQPHIPDWLTEAWQPISAYGPSPTTNIHSHPYDRGEAAVHVFMMVGVNRSTRRKPTQTRGEHANSTQKGPGTTGTTGIRTQSLLSVRRQW